MSTAVSLPRGVTAKVTGLEVWMDRALERMGQLRPDWDAGMVHDVRTALRRCRTMADTLREVNPDPGWRKLKKASKQVFHTLGDLRDAQVEQEWIKKLGSRSDPVRKHMLRALAHREKQFRAAADDALEHFDRKAWRKLSRKLVDKARFFPVESVVYRRQALEALNEAVALHQRARKSPSSIAWHRTRIGIKRFRYIVENFLPQRYEVWASDLKQMQTLLGDVHDLDVLGADIKRESSKFENEAAAQWLEKISSNRKSRLTEFRLKASGKNSPWLMWRAGFQWGHALIPASLPERRATRYAS